MPPPEKPPSRYGPVRLDRAQLGDVVGGRLLEGRVRRLVAVEAARLQPVERPVGAEQVREVAQVQHVAEHAGDQEERRPRPALAVVHGDEVREAARRPASARAAAALAARGSTPSRSAISAAQLAIVGASNSTEIGNSTR